MKCAVILAAVGVMLLPTGLHAADYCDDKIEPGESPDGKAMAMVSSMMSVVLAERYCDAPSTPLSQVYIVVEEVYGCGPRSRLEAELKKRMEEEKATDAMMADSAIHELIADGTNLTKAELDKRVKTVIDGRFGGCGELLKVQQDLEDRYRKPPKWPPEPDK
ncbi:hypothetical protein JQK88_29870 [Mesorhizobium caraganae]|uniref:hypothetical protein n=1 Tax=Mesorhizobium caraganae TaxID=483206 RepID=UPI00193A6C62|nr:hypothetical protein [Mesorhizobium caraganae]MBM2715341.1 hypothetical protein [Mesorhizobium caraganae]